MSSSTAEKVALLIIGTGMYVCGRGTDAHGTVLPAVMQAYRAGIIGDVLVASSSGESFVTFGTKLTELSALLGTDLPYRRYPSQNVSDPTAYLDAIRDLPEAAAVIVATPDHLHTEMALASIKAGKHVLVVKPLAPSIADARQLVLGVEKAGVYGAVDFHKRWDWTNLKLRDAIRQEVIGSPLYFHVEYSQRKNIPTTLFSAWVKHTTVFQYLGVHYADLIYFVTGDRPRRMIALGQSKWLAEQLVSTYDAIQVLVEWSKGFVSTILTNWIDPDCNSAVSQQGIKVVGTKGRFESDQTDRGVRIVTDSGGVEAMNPYFCQPYRDLDAGRQEYRGYGIESITQFLEDVRDIIRGKRSPAQFEGRRPSFSDALVSTAIVDGARLSLEHGSEWVHFAEDLRPYLK
ncbi:MAG: Gfo/Idh/MocA family oxidoreductase [Dehalococcoidia bacterium]